MADAAADSVSPVETMVFLDYFKDLPDRCQAVNVKS